VVSILGGDWNAKTNPALDKLVPGSTNYANDGFANFLSITKVEDLYRKSHPIKKEFTYFKNTKHKRGVIEQATRIDTWLGGPEICLSDVAIHKFDRKLSPDHARISLAIEIQDADLPDIDDEELVLQA